ncbi:MAG: hypothetical protein V1838_02005 [Patescibacteria group bacterium]
MNEKNERRWLEDWQRSEMKRTMFLVLVASFVTSLVTAFFLWGGRRIALANDWFWQIHFLMLAVIAMLIAAGAAILIRERMIIYSRKKYGLTGSHDG